MKTFFWALQAAVFYLFTLAFALLPERAVQPAGRLIGRACFALLRKRREIAIDNIRSTLPVMTRDPEWHFPRQSPEEIAREMFQNLGISLVETCRLYHGKGSEIIDRVEIRGREHVEAAKAKGKGVVILTGHCGNWELAALALSRCFETPMSVVARRQNSPYLNSMVERMRMRYNNRVIYKENALRNMMSVIRQNGMIGLLVDQAVLPEEGTLIKFLGRTAWASKAPVLLARKSGTAVVPAFICREADRHIIEIQPPLTFSGDNSPSSVVEDVQKYSRAIESFIIRHPVDWYWVHRRWKRAGKMAEAS